MDEKSDRAACRSCCSVVHCLGPSLNPATACSSSSSPPCQRTIGNSLGPNEVSGRAWIDRDARLCQNKAPFRAWGFRCLPASIDRIAQNRPGAFERWRGRLVCACWGCMRTDANRRPHIQSPSPLPVSLMSWLGQRCQPILEKPEGSEMSV